MNDEERRAGAPHRTTELSCEASTAFGALIAALEALAAGDLRLCEQILLGALEDGPAERPYPCRVGCYRTFEWPGLRDEHEARCSATEAAA